jgi:hypothetical protein
MMDFVIGHQQTAGTGTVSFSSFFYFFFFVYLFFFFFWFLGKDTGPHQDNVALLTNAVRANNLTMGLYFSQFEWYIKGEQTGREGGRRGALKERARR